MTRVKILSLICIGMMAINLALLAFLFFSKPGPPGPGGPNDGPKRMIIEKLRFDKDQVAAYEKLISKHKAEIEGAQEKLKDSKNKLFKTLRTDQDDSNADVIMEGIGDLQEEMEKIHYTHFQELKSICNPDQLAAYDELCLEIAKLFAPHQPKRRG